MKVNGDAVAEWMRELRLDESQVAARMRHLGLAHTSASWLRIAFRGNLALTAQEALVLAEALKVAPERVLVNAVGLPAAPELMDAAGHPVLRSRGHLMLLAGGAQ